jgi:hypothetical protein
MGLVEHEDLGLVGARELIMDRLGGLVGHAPNAHAVMGGELSDEPQRTIRRTEGCRPGAARCLSRPSLRTAKSVDLPRPGSAVSTPGVLDSIASRTRASASAKE